MSGRRQCRHNPRFYRAWVYRDQRYQRIMNYFYVREHLGVGELG